MQPLLSAAQNQFLDLTLYQMDFPGIVGFSTKLSHGIMNDLWSSVLSVTGYLTFGFKIAAIEVTGWAW